MWLRLCPDAPLAMSTFLTEKQRFSFGILKCSQWKVFHFQIFCRFYQQAQSLLLLTLQIVHSITNKFSCFWTFILSQAPPDEELVPFLNFTIIQKELVLNKCLFMYFDSANSLKSFTRVTEYCAVLSFSFFFLRQKSVSIDLYFVKTAFQNLGSFKLLVFLQINLFNPLLLVNNALKVAVAFHSSVRSIIQEIVLV